MHVKNLFTYYALVFLYVSCSQKSNPVVVFETDKGTIELEIFANEAPVTASNFMALVKGGIYNGACFYRVVRLDNQPASPVKIEVIQGGLKEDPIIENYQPIIHETTDKTGIKHLNGALSMARNEPGTASTEFFICVGDQPELDFGGKRNRDGQGFAAFGKVIKGMDVVRKIQQGEDQGQMLIKDVFINHAHIK